jgi:O-antigen/teichoic acid export membrane protein
VHFAIAASVAYKFSQYHAAGDRAKLEAALRDAIRWTFWPSLALAAAVLIAGRPLLAMFGQDFVDAYPLMFVLSLGLLARAAVGPGERFLNMLDRQRACTAIYAAAFAVNVIGCLTLIPLWGTLGAAIAVCAAIVVESVLLFWFAKRRLRFHLFIFGGSRSA